MVGEGGGGDGVSVDGGRGGGSDGVDGGKGGGGEGGSSLHAASRSEMDVDGLWLSIRSLAAAALLGS